MKISVEIEPPSGPYVSLHEIQDSITEEIDSYLPYVNMISITNRPVFGYSSLSTAKWLQEHIGKVDHNVRVSLHLTTRLTHYDVYTQILDAHAHNISDILPILGNPRGPKDPNYFENGFDLLGFVSYLKTGKTNYLSSKYKTMNKSGKLVDPLINPTFMIGNVIDINPCKITRSGKQVSIRENQIAYAQKKQKLGAEYLITQGFFKADYYFDFIDQAGIEIPIYAGILPARLRLIELFGLPIDTLVKQDLRGQFTTDDEKAAGNRYCKALIEDLEDRGCGQAHIYTISNTNNFFEITGIQQ
ncbi:MAG: methylenetetrahydrofolate reductase [Candidatus Heimdallarchaeota archaeon]|nr:methylenetetrahydrofolate reductase [Candidatus Heimdallarchaeota archaeon]